MSRCLWWTLIFQFPIISGQFIATSHDQNPQRVAEEGKSPSFREKSSMLPAGWYPWDSYGTELQNNSNGWTQNRHQKTLGIDKQYSSQCDTYLHPWKLKWNWKFSHFQIGNTSSNGRCDVALSCEFRRGCPLFVIAWKFRCFGRNTYPSISYMDSSSLLMECSFYQQVQSYMIWIKCSIYRDQVTSCKNQRLEPKDHSK